MILFPLILRCAEEVFAARAYPLIRLKFVHLTLYLRNIDIARIGLSCNRKRDSPPVDSIIVLRITSSACVCYVPYLQCRFLFIEIICRDEMKFCLINKRK